MALKLPDLATVKAVPMGQKVLLLVLLLALLGAPYYYYVEMPQQETLARLHAEIGRLDNEISTNRLRVQHLPELKRLNEELQKQLARNQEKLPPEEEAISLLKQLSDLGVRIGLDFKLWKPGPRVEDSSRLFVRLPVDVEMSGGYHTLALFFDRISKLPRIINVSKIKMGAGRIERNRLYVPTTFSITAFATPSGASVSPPSPAGSAAAPPPPPPKP